MFIRRLLFETKIGLLLMALLERQIGLALVDADWLAHRTSGIPIQSEGEKA